MLVSASSSVSIRHSAEFKTRVVMACEQAGASIAAIALTNGVNANLVHRWIRERRSGVVWADGEGRNYVLHSDEFKRAIVARCRQPGTSMTGVAYSHGLRPALVHKWIQAEKRTAFLPQLAPTPTEDWLPVVVSEEIATQGTRSRSRPVLPAAAEAVSIVLEISGARLTVPVGSEDFLDTLRVILERLK
jgi:transposase-like protein